MMYFKTDRVPYNQSSQGSKLGHQQKVGIWPPYPRTGTKVFMAGFYKGADRT